MYVVGFWYYSHHPPLEHYQFGREMIAEDDFLRHFHTYSLYKFLSGDCYDPSFLRTQTNNTNLFINLDNMNTKLKVRAGDISLRNVFIYNRVFLFYLFSSYMITPVLTTMTDDDRKFYLLLTNL